MEENFYSLTLRKKLKVIFIWLKLIIIDLRLKIIPSKFNKKWLFNSKKFKESKQVNEVELERFLKYIRIASSHSYIFNMSCLRQSLLIRRYLNSQKITSKIVFGLNKDSKQNYNAHAWVEVDELKIDPTNNFVYFTSFKNN